MKELCFKHCSSKVEIAFENHEKTVGPKMFKCPKIPACLFKLMVAPAILLINSTDSQQLRAWKRAWPTNCQGNLAICNLFHKSTRVLSYWYYHQDKRVSNTSRQQNP